MKRNRLLAILPIVFLLASCQTNDSPPTVSSTGASPAPSSEKPPSFDSTMKADSAARRGETTIKPYPFKTCAVQINRPFKDGKPKYRRVYQGYEVLICCDPCLKAFEAVPEAYMPRIIAAADAKEARRNAG